MLSVPWENQSNHTFGKADRKVPPLAYIIYLNDISPHDIYHKFEMFNTSHDVDIYPQFTLYVLFWCKLYWSRSFWQCKTMQCAHPIWSPNCRGHGLSRGRRGSSFSWEIWNFWTVPWKPADATLAGSEGSLSRKYFIDIGDFSFHKVVFSML